MGKTGSGDRTRTCNNSINSRVRYQLRHTGMDFIYRIKTLKFNRFASYCQVDFPSTHWARATPGSNKPRLLRRTTSCLGLKSYCPLSREMGCWQKKEISSTSGGSPLAHFHSPFQRFQQGHRVGIFNIRTHWQAPGNPSNLDRLKGLQNF